MKVSIKKKNAFALYQSFTYISNNTTDVLTTYSSQKSADALKGEAEAVTKAFTTKLPKYSEYTEKRNDLVRKYAKPESINEETFTFETKDGIDPVKVRKELDDLNTEYKDSIEGRNAEIKEFNEAFIEPIDCSEEDVAKFVFECDLSKVKLSILSKIKDVPSEVTRLLMQYELITDDIGE